MDQFGSVVLVRKTLADFAKAFGLDEAAAIGLAYLHTKRFESAVAKEIRNAQETKAKSPK